MRRSKIEWYVSSSAANRAMKAQEEKGWEVFDIQVISDAQDKFVIFVWFAKWEDEDV